MADIYLEEPATRSPERSQEGENLTPHQVPELVSQIFGRLQTQNSGTVESLVHEINDREDDDGTELPDNPSEEPHQSVEEVVCLLITVFYWKETHRMKQRSREHFSSSKIDKIRAFFRNLSKFHEKIAKICNKNL